MNYLEPDEDLQDEALENQPDTDEAIVVEDEETDEESGLTYTKQEPVGTEDKSDDGKKKIGNPFAALRVANRENRILSERLARVVTVLEQQQSQKPEPEQEPEEEIDYGADPIGSVNSKVDRLLKESEANKAAEEERRKEAKANEVISKADTGIIKFREKVGPEVYDQAVQHLVKLRMSDLQEVYPNATQDEIANAIMREAIDEKYKLAASGKNPGEVFYNYAIRHGFKPEPKKESKKPDAKEQISRARERDSKSRTIASASGKPPRTLSADDFIGMSEDDFDDWVTTVAKNKGKSTNPLKIREILDSARQ
jgi:hypothetical protein